jgi:hypothetical protein
MGVFARILRRSAATEERSTAGARTTAQPVGAETEATGPSGNRSEATAGAGTDTAEDTAIPRQQTAGQAADNEAGEDDRG